MAWRDVINRLVGPPQRVAGRPPSGNGASSLHLFWLIRAERVVEVSTVIEVLERPVVDRLCFWALQASFADEHGQYGTGHLGLQHHPQYPEGGAVNWGGYHHPTSGHSGELPGSELMAPSALGNANTCNFDWVAGRPYRYRISRASTGGWAGSVIDESTAVETVVRTLHCEGDFLTNPMVWTEAFTDCDHPSVAVRWSELRAVTASGETIEPIGVRVNYQTVSAGGCSNTTADTDDLGFVQRTATERLVPPSSVLRLAR